MKGAVGGRNQGVSSEGVSHVGQDDQFQWYEMLD